MAEIRMTLISDATSEFPDNTNVDFKVRLAEPLHLKAEERWQASLVSMSTQNRPNTPLDRLGLRQSDTLFVYGIRVVNDKFSNTNPLHVSDIKEARVTVGEVFGDSINSVPGVEFWSRISDYLLHYQSLEIFQNSKKNKHWARSFDDEMVVTSVDPSRDQFHVKSTSRAASPSTFGVNLVVAKYFGLVEENRGGGYNLGRNARYACEPTFANGRSSRHLYYPLESDMQAFSDAMTVKQLSNGEDVAFFSRYMEWTFRNLNVSFDDVTRRYKTQLAMVYCDVVESSLVGNQKHALLRELMLKDSGGQRQFVEPLHYQWLSVRNNVIEVVHVQVADADGKLLGLPSGKTMVTVTLKRTA